MDFEEYYLRNHVTDLDDRDYWWHPRNPIAVAHRQQLEWAVLWALDVIAQPLEHLDVLDVGCGSGRHLRHLVELGADARRLVGVDYIPERILQARRMSPPFGLGVVDASALPFAPASFDLVTQFVALSSMLDREARRRAAAEMVRVARPGGWILTYDVVRPSPGRIPDGMPPEEVAALFPGVDWLGRRMLHRRGLSRTAPHPAASALLDLVPVTAKTNVLMVGRVRAPS